VVEILRNIDIIDFLVLYSGKVCVDEIPRVRRVARTDCIKTPKFLTDLERYKKTLRYMAYINGFGPKPVRKKSGKAKSTPKLTRKQSTNGRNNYASSPDRKNSRKADQEGNNACSSSPTLYKVKRTPLTQPLSRIVHVTEDILNPLDDIDEDALEDDDNETTTCPPGNAYATAGATSRNSYKLLGRPKSTPNKVRKVQSDTSSTSSGSSSGGSSNGDCESLAPPKRIDWFGLLERKWDF
jgi:hypothetical protein